jgi:hypothetical protein
MKRFFLSALLLAATSSFAATGDPALLTQVSDDAHAIERLAQVSKRGELPRDLVRRIVNEDIDQLRGKRSDGTYLYASFDRVESGRIQDDYTVQATSEDKAKIELKGQFVYRLVLEVPTRRLLVTKNRHIWVERIELEYIPQDNSVSKMQSIPIQAWLEPGTSKTFDFDEVGRQATVRVLARADKQHGYANVSLTLLKARVSDLPGSPYAELVANEKALLKALEAEDLSSIRNVAARVYEGIGLRQPAPMVASVPAPAPAPTTRSIDVIAPRPTSTGTAAAATAPSPDVYVELLSIEDLLTGTEPERREGTDRLHQLLRKLRPK